MKGIIVCFIIAALHHKTLRILLCDRIPIVLRDEYLHLVIGIRPDDAILQPGEPGSIFCDSTMAITTPYYCIRANIWQGSLGLRQVSLSAPWTVTRAAL